MAMPDVATPAPGFELRDQSGESVSLAGQRGRWVVLYFYPKDNTPGCTKEACNFRDNYEAITATGAVVLGVSADSGASHTRFAQKYEIPFKLLVDDQDHGVARAYGAWGTRKNYGREYEGIIRSTFVIDPEGNIAKVWPKVKPDLHGEEVLTWLKAHATR